MTIDIDRLETLAKRGVMAGTDDTLALIARLREAEAREQALAAHVEALQEKQLAETCACSHDYATDVCLGHSPMLQAERERADALAAYVEDIKNAHGQKYGLLRDPEDRLAALAALAAVGRVLRKGPTTSLARLKAQWQAEALEEAAALYSHEWKDEFAGVAVSIMRKGRGYIYPEGLAERAAELRRQAEGGE